MTAEELFWDLVEPMYADPAVQRSTMMGLPCVRLDGRFFASLDRRTGALRVKLSSERVRQLIDAGHGQPFAPAGRTFREWSRSRSRTAAAGRPWLPRPATTPLPSSPGDAGSWASRRSVK
jgi:hypothetical protein